MSSIGNTFSQFSSHSRKPSPMPKPRSRKMNVFFRKRVRQTHSICYLEVPKQWPSKLNRFFSLSQLRLPYEIIVSFCFLPIFLSKSQLLIRRGLATKGSKVEQSQQTSCFSSLTVISPMKLTVGCLKQNSLTLPMASRSMYSMWSLNMSGEGVQVSRYSVTCSSSPGFLMKCLKSGADRQRLSQFRKRKEEMTQALRMQTAETSKRPAPVQASSASRWLFKKSMAV